MLKFYILFYSIILVEETIKFIRTIDRLFDFLNTRSPFGKGLEDSFF